MKRIDIIPRVRLTLMALLVLLPGAPAGAGVEALSVSPGQIDWPAQVSGTCPTFSWSAVAGAERYELVAYEVTEEGTADLRQPALARQVPGAALSWTPDMDSCFAPGRTYMWFIRAEGGSRTSDWSTGRLFRTPAAPSRTEVVALLRRYLESGGTLEELVATTPAAWAGPDDPVVEDTRAPAAVAQPVAVTPSRSAATEEAMGPRLAPAARTVLDNVGGGISSTTSGSPSAALQGINVYIPTETVRGYLGVQGSLEFDEMKFLGTAIQDDEIGVLGVSSASDDQFGSDNYGVVGVGTGSGSGGRFFSGSGVNEVLLGTSTDAFICQDCIDASDIGTKAVRADELDSVRVVSVECHGECSDSTLDEICGVGYQAIVVDCEVVDEDLPEEEVPCGGDNVCFRNFVGDDAPLSNFCNDVSGWDAQVYCLPD